MEGQLTTQAGQPTSETLHTSLTPPAPDQLHCHRLVPGRCRWTPTPYLEHVLLRGPAGGGVGDVADGAVGLHRHDPHGDGHRLARQHRRVQHVAALRGEEGRRKRNNPLLNLGLESSRRDRCVTLSLFVFCPKPRRVYIRIGIYALQCMPYTLYIPL